MTWQQLTPQQRTMLRILLDKTEAQARDEVRWWSTGGRYRPASVWRWLPYNQRYGPPNNLKQRFLDAKLMGRAFSMALESLAQLGLLAWRTDEYGIEIKLLPAGEALVRTALDRPALPPGTLYDWQWKALVRIASAGQRGISPDPTTIYYPDTNIVTWSMCVELMRYRGGALVQEVSRWNWYYQESESRVVATPFGLDYIGREAERYAVLYPAIKVPPRLRTTKD